MEVCILEVLHSTPRLQSCLKLCKVVRSDVKFASWKSASWTFVLWKFANCKFTSPHTHVLKVCVMKVCKLEVCDGKSSRFESICYKSL